VRRVRVKGAHWVLVGWAMVACDHVAALHPSIGIFVGISSVSPAITKTAAATSVRGGPEADMTFNLNSLTYTKNVAMWS